MNSFKNQYIFLQNIHESEWVIKYNSLFHSIQWGSCIPYKMCNHDLYNGIIIFPHMW